MTREVAIKTAARWWAGKLKAKQPHSNGDKSAASLFACLLADMGAAPLRDEQLEVFAGELESQIDKHMNTYGDRYVEIGCDYGPCRMLDAAAQKAGINELNFPFKTSVYIKNQEGSYSVYARDGYGAIGERVDPVPMEVSGDA